jgi:hypothetical protein
MMPIFVPTTADLVTAAALIFGGALFLLGCWLWAEWMFKAFDEKERQDEAQAQSAPADPAFADAPWGLDDGVVRRRKNRDR